MRLLVRVCVCLYHTCTTTGGPAPAAGVGFGGAASCLTNCAVVCAGSAVQDRGRVAVPPALLVQRLVAQFSGGGGSLLRENSIALKKEEG